MSYRCVICGRGLVLAIACGNAPRHYYCHDDERRVRSPISFVLYVQLCWLLSGTGIVVGGRTAHVCRLARSSFLVALLANGI